MPASADPTAEFVPSEFLGATLRYFSNMRTVVSHHASASADFAARLDLATLYAALTTYCIAASLVLFASKKVRIDCSARRRAASLPPVSGEYSSHFLRSELATM